MGGSRSVQGSISGSLPIASIFDKFGKHGLAGLVIAALFYLVMMFHNDSMQISTATIDKVAISSERLKISVDEQTNMLRALSMTLDRAKLHDTVYIAGKRLMKDDVSNTPKKRITLTAEAQGRNSQSSGPYWTVQKGK